MPCPPPLLRSSGVDPRAPAAGRIFCPAAFLCSAATLPSPARGQLPYAVVCSAASPSDSSARDTRPRRLQNHCSHRGCLQLLWLGVSLLTGGFRPGSQMKLACRSHIRDDRTQAPERYGGKWNVLRSPPQDAGTCHFNVVDRHGMAVAMTTTVKRQTLPFSCAPPCACVRRRRIAHPSWRRGPSSFAAPDMAWGDCCPQKQKSRSEADAQPSQEVSAQAQRAERVTDTSCRIHQLSPAARSAGHSCCGVGLCRHSRQTFTDQLLRCFPRHHGEQCHSAGR